MSKRLTEEFKKARGWYYVGSDKYYWRNCDYCGKEYQGMGQFYCSKSCKLIANPVWDLQEVHPMHQSEVVAKVSKALKGRKLTGEMYLSAIRGLEIGRTKIDLEYRTSQMPRGKDHHAYIEDRTQLKRSNRRGDPAYVEWRRAVLTRDGFQCKIDNEDCDETLEVHHSLRWADYPDLRYEINNGITLCHAHHPRKRAEEKRLEPEFQAIVTASKKDF